MGERAISSLLKQTINRPGCPAFWLWPADGPPHVSSSRYCAMAPGKSPVGQTHRASVYCGVAYPRVARGFGAHCVSLRQRLAITSKNQPGPILHKWGNKSSFVYGVGCNHLPVYRMQFRGALASAVCCTLLLKLNQTTRPLCCELCRGRALFVGRACRSGSPRPGAASP